MFRGEDTGGDDGGVCALPIGDRLCELGGSSHVGERLGGTDLFGDLALLGQRVDGDDVGRPAVGSALDRVDTNTTDTHHDDRLTWLDLG